MRKSLEYEEHWLHPALSPKELLERINTLCKNVNICRGLVSSKTVFEDRPGLVAAISEDTLTPALSNRSTRTEDFKTEDRRSVQVKYMHRSRRVKTEDQTRHCQKWGLSTGSVTPEALIDNQQHTIIHVGSDVSQHQSGAGFGREHLTREE